jgi:hypothetical protein
VEEESPHVERIEKALKILAALNVAFLDADPRRVSQREWLCLNTLLDACFAWLKLYKIPFIMDDETRLYRLRRSDECSE